MTTQRVIPEKTITIYQFEELEDNVQQKVLEKFWSYNVEHFDWWDCTYEDAETVGFKITEFDLDRRSMCNGDFIIDAENTAKLMIENHGENCETYIDAKNFLKLFTPMESELDSIEQPDGDYDYDRMKQLEDDLEDLKNEFLGQTKENYRIMLENEYEYLTSKEAIKEALHDYEFDIDGNDI